MNESIEKDGQIELGEGIDFKGDETKFNTLILIVDLRKDQSEYFYIKQISGYCARQVKFRLVGNQKNNSKRFSLNLRFNQCSIGHIDEYSSIFDVNYEFKECYFSSLTLTSGSVSMINTMFKRCSLSGLKRFDYLLTDTLKKLILPTSFLSYFLDKSEFSMRNSKQFLSLDSIRSSKIRSELFHETTQPNYEKRKFFLNDSANEINLNIEINNKSNSETKIDCVIKGIVFSHFFSSGKINGKLSLEYCRLNGFNLDDFSISEETEIYEIEAVRESDSALLISNSELSNVVFRGVNFNSFGFINFSKSNISSTKFSSCVFPGSPRGIRKFGRFQNSDKESKKLNLPKYHMLIELKEALKKNGDFFEERKMNAHALEVMRRTSKVNLFEKEILRWNSWSNYHGTSVSRALIVFLTFSISLYFIYLFSIGKLLKFEHPVDWNLVGYYFQFINPTHRLDFLESSENLKGNGWAVGIDSISRLVIGYAIFQFIVAFRQFGRK